MKLILSESFGFASAPKTEEERQWQLRFIQEVQSETVRGMVLNITSFIDELLIKLLLSYFPNHAQAEKLLTSLESCLSSITERANIAYALSLLRKKEFEAIKLIAKIRNEFAHKWDDASFDNEMISKLVRKLPGEYFQNMEGSNKAKFNFICAQIIQQLLERHYYARTISDLLPKEYKDIFDLPLEERQKIMRKIK